MLEIVLDNIILVLDNKILVLDNKICYLLRFINGSSLALFLLETYELSGLFPEPMMHR